ncbi:ABC transporter permease [Mesorhizobium sp. J428]|uniref:ABC transporter permease n=1 Tax=Mesorhizobium sp. J428 TaxID=2898440 RepID=UPI0021514D0D|nr:ABC transporter permease [Mesorhizobium sp. J428]MCR5856314.1 ABC transporter permease [Mesorhizobium sp. J428]
MIWAPKNLGLILDAAGQHLVLSFLSVLIGGIVALILGIISARRPRLYAFFLTVAGIIFVIPSLALFAFLIPVMGLGMKPAITGLSSYCVLILLRNVVTGLRNVPDELLDAADGMGFSRWQRLIRVELPLALPLIVSGVRIALVTVIGIATIAAFIDAGGLGSIILAGIDQNFPEKIIVGGGLTALIAIFFDTVMTWLERRLQRWRQA